MYNNIMGKYLVYIICLHILISFMFEKWINIDLINRLCFNILLIEFIRQTKNIIIFLQSFIKI